MPETVSTSYYPICDRCFTQAVSVSVAAVCSHSSITDAQDAVHEVVCDMVTRAEIVNRENTMLCVYTRCELELVLTHRAAQRRIDHIRKRQRLTKYVELAAKSRIAHAYSAEVSVSLTEFSQDLFRYIARCIGLAVHGCERSQLIEDIGQKIWKGPKRDASQATKLHRKFVSGCARVIRKNSKLNIISLRDPRKAAKLVMRVFRRYGWRNAIADMGGAAA